MPNKRIAFPLLFKKVTAFPGPTWYLDESVYLDTIHDEDFGAFQRHPSDDYKSPIKIKTKCIYIDDPEYTEFDTYTRNIATRIKFVFNNFTSGTPVVLPYAALINISSKVNISQICDIETVANLHHIKEKTFSFKKSTRSIVSSYYKTIGKSCNENPTTFFTLERFNSSLTRTELHDKIVDITISLESLMSGTQELRYRFALTHSFLSKSSVDDRLSAFDLLLSLYDARSGIVHGDMNSKDKKKALEKVTENWVEVIRIATASINYYLFYLTDNKRDEWDNHLKKLIFGKEERIVS